MHNIDNADLNLLKSLQALISEKHVGRAAQRMNITQPAMSHALARLRKQFDDPLFVRTARGLVPTARTEDLMQSLTTVLSGVEALFAPESFDPAHAEGMMRIETHDFIATGFLAEPIRKIQSGAPGVTIDIRTIGKRSYDRLESHDADLIVASGLQAKPHFMQQTLVAEDLVCLLDKDHPALARWTARNLFRYPHARTSLLESRDDPVDQYARKMAVPKRITGLVTENLHLQASFLKGTQMIAFLPETLANQAAVKDGLTIRKCPFPLPALSIKAIWHERNQHSPLHQWIRGRIKVTEV
ncbi:MAG: LysR family transcriptional regulator [Parasphingorhabdus sp.]